MLPLECEDQAACYGFEVAEVVGVSDGEQVAGCATGSLSGDARRIAWQVPTRDFEPLLSSWRWSS
jgi:hypothetical protein